MTQDFHEEYELVVGLEVHAQLLTDSKIFSGAPTTFGAEPNSQVNEVDLGLPGALPSLNRKVVDYALRAGLALNCEINPWSQFARKNYFYPDLPKGYQISQHVAPICGEGYLDIDLEDGSTRRIELIRIHMEEDAGKSSHVAGQPYSLVDLNRAGVPLIEIVSKPDIRHPDEAIAYMKELRTILVYLGVCDGNMEEGSLRCDANVSVRKKGAKTYGTRCELKNINSFKFVGDAIRYEAHRQIELLEDGEEITQETRLYNPDKGRTYSMRSKEEAHDYRYFPDPDIPPLVVDDAWLKEVESSLPELPRQKRSRYREEYGLSAYDAGVLCADRPVAEYFDEAVKAYPENPKGVANWVINEVLRETSAGEIGSFPARPDEVAKLVRLIDEDVISGKIAKQVFEEMAKSGGDPEEIVEEKGLRQVTDESAIEKVIEDIMSDNPEQAQQLLGGDDKIIGWFMGQVMQATRGKANPQVAQSVLRDKLGSA